MDWNGIERFYELSMVLDTSLRQSVLAIEEILLSDNTMKEGSKLFHI